MSISPTAWLWALPGAEGQAQTMSTFPALAQSAQPHLQGFCKSAFSKKKQSSEEAEFSQRASKPSSRAGVPQTPNWVQVSSATAGT